MTESVGDLRKTAEAATPGPWHWAGNADNHQLYLATWIKGAGRCQVMDFERWGMQSAIPRFLDDESLMMQTAKNRLVFEVARNQGLPDGTPRSHPKVYRADVVDVMHPNAEFIATFDPATVLALLSRLEQAEQAVQRVREVATAMANHSLPESPRGGAWETAHGAQLFAKDILETLDGDARRLADDALGGDQHG